MAKSPERIRVACDSREKKPWPLNPAIFDVYTTTLLTGDYALGDHPFSTAYERKSLNDLVQTTVHEWQRFRRELYRLAALDHAMIIVEANLEDIIANRYESDVSPESVLGRVNSIMLDHSIPVCFFGERQQCVHMFERLLIQAAKKLR